jgi:O-antigen ligase
MTARDWSRITFALLLGILVVIPLWIAPDSYVWYDITPKLLATLAGGSIALGWLSVWGKGSLRQINSGLPGWLLKVFAAHAVLLLVSTAASVNPVLSLGGSIWRRQGAISRFAVLAIALCVLARLAAERTELRRLLRVVTFTGLAAAIYGTLQYFGLDPWLPPESYREGYWDVSRPPATLGHASYSANYLVLICFAGLALTGKAERAWIRAAGGATVVVSLAAIALSGTRAGLLGLAAGGAVFLWFTRPKLGWRHALVPAAGTLAIAGFLLSPASVSFRHRLEEWKSDATGGTRPLLWRDAVEMGLARPWFGFGLETFVERFPQFEGENLASAFPNHFNESPHNIVIEAWVEQGLAGLAALGALLAVAWGCGLVALRRQKWMAASLLAGLAGLITAQLFTPMVLVIYVFLMLAVVMLAALSFPDTDLQPAPPSGPDRVWGAGCLAFAIALLAVAAQVEDLEASVKQADMLASGGEGAAAVAEYDHWPRLSLLGEIPDLWFSRKLLAMLSAPGNSAHAAEISAAARRAARQATESSSERFNAHYQAAVLAGLNNDAKAAEDSLQSAIRWAPLWYKPHWKLAQLFQAMSKSGDAERELRLAIKLNGGKQPGNSVD